MKQTETTNIVPDLYNPIVFIDKPDREDMVSLSLKSTLEAFRHLTPEAFGLYMWLALYDSNKAYRLDGAEICKEYYIDPEIYMDAYNELLDHDYLIATTKTSGVLYFHDRPYVPPYLFEWKDGNDVKKCDDEPW